MYATMLGNSILDSIGGVGALATTPRVLLVDDDPLYVRRATIALTGTADLRIASTREAALAAIADWWPDVVVLDMFLRDGDAIRLPEELRARGRSRVLGVVYLAKGAGAQTRFQSLGTNFLGVVERERDAEALRAALRAALNHRDGA